MFRALLICPEDDCAEAFDAVGELEQLEALMCDCGYTLRVERLSETDDGSVADDAFELTPLR
jgi:hypothetical protein